MTGRLANLDFRILNTIRSRFSCAALDFLMPKISFAGNGGMIWILSACIMFFNRHYRKASLTLLTGLLAGVVICNLLLKNLAARKRPCWINSGEKMQINIPKDYSFPSGHTMSSFMAATIIMQVSFTLGCIAVFAAALIGFSRLYLYVHFPTDVLAGAALGIALGFAVWNAAQSIPLF